jgi:sulfite exporter TauE/SafE
MTYCSLGLIFGLAGKVLWLAGTQRWLALALGLILLAGLVASRRKSIVAGKIALSIDRLKRPLAKALGRPSLVSTGFVGVLNGLLPCGLVYVACAAAATTGTPLGALTYMAAFGAGTLPMMLGIGLSGRLIPFPLRLKLQRAVPVAIFLVAVLLILRSFNLGVPGLIAHFEGHPAQCCVPP